MYMYIMPFYSPIYMCICSMYIYIYMYMKIHVPNMLAKGVDTINKQSQQTTSHNGFKNS